MFRCCIAEEDPQLSRRRIDRSMIGHPTDFRHTAHIGTGDLNGTNNSNANGNSSNGTAAEADRLVELQSQMRSKGGYGQQGSMAVRVTSPPHIANARSLDEVGRK